ncbi:MAG: proline iminopeptidase-family hydrolase [Planctomycetia bacterium]|nr:proline iminopeptidase-family hydrolase [Planctomycetia bacterium]
MPAGGVQEGYVRFRQYRVWYRSVGATEAGKLPVLCLHGGPGATHDYLEPLEALANRGRRVIFYDQLGGGNSDQPHDPSLWSVSLFVEELGAVIAGLGLKQLHLFGQSWGGMLGMEFALTQPAGLASLTVASSPASMIQWVEECNRLRAELPQEVQDTLLHHERAGSTDSSAYQEAVMVFNRRYLCRLDPWPEPLLRSFHKMAKNPEVYHTMNGPSEFHITGKFKDWNIIPRLGEIRVPTLVTSGRYDEATPKVAETVHRGIPGSRWVLFEDSSHSAHLEEPERFLKVVADFLDEVEQQ